MTPEARQFTFGTVEAFDRLLDLARRRLAHGVTLLDRDDLAGAADELAAAARLATQASDGAAGLAGTLRAEAVRP